MAITDLLQTSSFDDNTCMSTSLSKPEGTVWRVGESVSVLCDLLTSTEYDRVMPLFGDGSLTIWKAIKANASGKVLDLGTGSGVLALEAAKYANTVIGTDINPKAIRYARSGALLNNLAGKCEFREGNLYEPVQGEKFDLLISNPPFMPHPPSFRLFLSVDGGADGMSVVRKVIEQAPQHLDESGRAVFLTMSLGDKDEPLVYRYLRDSFGKSAVRIKTRHLFSDIRSDAEPLFDLFKEFAGYAEWKKDLLDRGLTHVYHMLHEIEPAPSFEHTESHGFDPIGENTFSWSLNGRIRRYQLWIDKVYHQPATAIRAPQ